MTLMPNLVSLTRPSLQILDKTQMGVFPVSGFLLKSLINKNGHNSRTSNDIVIKLGPVTKLDKRNRATSKKFDDDFVLTNYNVVVFFFRFMANLEHSGTRILDAWSITFTFPLIVTLYLTKIENRTKKSQAQLSYYCFE